MKNRIFVIVAILILIILAIFIGFKIAHVNVKDYLFTNKGTLVDGHKDLIEHLKNIEDETERKKQIDYALEQNIITNEEAIKIYNLP